MYRVLKPFSLGEDRAIRGQTLDKSIEGVRNFASLKRAKFIEKMVGSDFSKQVPRVFIARRSFEGYGQRYAPDDLVDLREVSWPNLGALVSSGYLRYATERDVARHTAHSPHAPAGATPCPPGDQKTWKSTAWLVDRYVNKQATIPEMAKEAECSVSSIWGALKGAGIKTRPRGRPNHGGSNGNN